MLVTFEGIVGSSYWGDLAIDDVSISRGSCYVPTKSPTLPPSTSPDYYITTKPSISKSTITPQTPSIEEIDESVMVKIRDLDMTKWDTEMKDDFKREVARVATEYCAADGARCQITQTR
ncbi:hypothetical protein OS493_027025 [Desmophyllum pertusum]|uniref:MAM domain-containing protein n=1 Tax=Desmophyllum pertusum TaxID=174260 RepID=A0A9W9YM75_9CNID|nr:hypothetical protein OS493_027025 [Desmophyllum pertusum]